MSDRPTTSSRLAKGQRVEEQLEYGTVKVVEVEHALNEAAQQQLVDVEQTLLSVQAPPGCT
jgi:hypothetical protein